VYLLVAAPTLDLYHQRDARLEDERMLAPRLSTAAAELPTLRTRVTQLRTAASASQITLDGASDAIASANLQSRIDGLAASAGATIGSTEALPAENQGGYRRIGLRIAVNGAYDAVVKLLAAIEKGTPPLVLSNLQIHGTAQPSGPSQPSGTGQPGSPPPSARLDAGFEVYGFRSTDASPSVK
jgi:general secretion pathway protein M